MSLGGIMRRPTNVCALVTGAASGIGRAVALRIGVPDLPLALVDRDAQGLQQTAIELRDRGSRAETYQADVSSEDDVTAAFRQAQAALGPVGILVNVAGIQTDSVPVRDLSPEEWQRVLRVNLTSVFLCCRAALPGMVRLGWGRIVSTSSILAARGRAGTSAYAASKAGIIGFTRSLAVEVAGDRITVNAVMPSMVDTPLVRRNTTEVQIGERGRQLAIGRVAEPEEVARAVAFLISDDASYVSGHSLAISGASYILA
jgi:3-oxoacyl-[acyl-carrier protein] reductase